VLPFGEGLLVCFGGVVESGKWMFSPLDNVKLRGSGKLNFPCLVLFLVRESGSCWAGIQIAYLSPDFVGVPEDNPTRGGNEYLRLSSQAQTIWYLSLDRGEAEG